MEKILEDILEVENVLEKYPSANYDIIYARCNENLPRLFSNFDVKDKKVLTVLSSSDQLFRCLYNGCGEIHTFDINKLTKYYFYLRKWNILYNNEYYLKDSFTSYDIFNLLNKVEGKLDKEKDIEAFEFWYKLIRFYPAFMVKDLFYRGFDKRENVISDLDLLREKLENFDLNFNNIDLGSEFSLPDTYDVIITSNISEYFPYDIKRISLYRDNLYKLLKDNGIVVSSHLMEKTIPYSEWSMFMDNFDSTEFPEYDYMLSLSGKTSPGYCYKKIKTDVNKK